MEFTIKETFSYFGRLLKLKPDLVASRQAELLKLLQLGEEEDRQVRGKLWKLFQFQLSWSRKDILTLKIKIWMVIRCAASAEASNVDYLLLWPSFISQEFSFSTNPRLATLSFEVAFTPPGGRRPLDETSHLGTPWVSLQVWDSETWGVVNLPIPPYLLRQDNLSTHQPLFIF